MSWAEEQFLFAMLDPLEQDLLYQLLSMCGESFLGDKQNRLTENMETHFSKDEPEISWVTKTKHGRN